MRYDADMEEALVSSKLDAIGQEYNLLLAGQLEEQRRWFEGRHAQVTPLPYDSAFIHQCVHTWPGFLQRDQCNVTRLPPTHSYKPL